MAFDPYAQGWQPGQRQSTFEDVLPGAAPVAATAPTSGGSVDAASIRQQVLAAFAKKGVSTPSDQEVNYWVDKASKPDLYSDNQWRVGWNPYWEQKLITGAASVDPSLAGTEGIVSAPAGYQPSGGGSSANVGAYTNPFSGTFTAPPMRDLGGHSGLSYIPDLPQFKAPTLQDMLQDPSYQFRVGQGEQALEQSAAARGLLNTGGTLKDILNYGQSAASQEYGNVWNRKMAEYQPQLTQWSTLANAGAQQNTQDYSNAWSKYLQDYNQYRNWQNDAFDKSFKTSTA